MCVFCSKKLLRRTKREECGENANWLLITAQVLKSGKKRCSHKIFIIDFSQNVISDPVLYFANKQHQSKTSIPIYGTEYLKPPPNTHTRTERNWEVVQRRSWWMHWRSQTTVDRRVIYSANPRLGLNHSLWETNSPFRHSLYCLHTHFDCFLLSLFLQN